MGHEDAVYLAKLAEQAERYEGSSVSFDNLWARINISQKWLRT